MIPQRALRPDYSVSRLILGGWQFSPGHHPDPYDLDAVLEMLVEVADLGVTTFDCADIYSGVEARIGAFLARNRAERTGAPLAQSAAHAREKIRAAGQVALFGAVTALRGAGLMV